jgi:hypothetical protein
MESREADGNKIHVYNSPINRVCAKKATQFQSAATGPKILVYFHLDTSHRLGTLYNEPSFMQCFIICMFNFVEEKQVYQINLNMYSRIIGHLYKSHILNFEWY